MLRLWVGVFIALFPFCSLWAENKVSRPLGLELVLPVNEAKEVVLAVQLPQNFRPMQSFKNQNLNNKEIFFAPVNAGEVNQKEMILLIPKLHSKISAIDMVDKFTEQFKKTSQKIAILKEQKKEYNGFMHAARLMMYEYNNETELLNVYAISGPEHLIVLQYSIKIQHKADLKTAITKILTFFNQGVQIRKQAVKPVEIKLKDLI